MSDEKDWMKVAEGGGLDRHDVEIDRNLAEFEAALELRRREFRESIEALRRSLRDLRRHDDD